MTGDPVRADWERLGGLVAETGAGGPETVHVRIAEHTVRLEITGARLAAALRESLGHLTGPAASADLVIEAVHGAELDESFTPATELDSDQPHAYTLSGDRRLLAHLQSETYAVLDRAAGCLRAFVGDIHAASLYERGRPFETPLTVWLRDRGIAVVHGAAVAVGDVGALLVGRSGSGKSTLAAGCLATGLSLVNDDKVAVTRGDDGFRAHAVNTSLHLTKASLDLVGPLADLAEPPRRTRDDKYRVPVTTTHRDRVAASAAIAAIVVPRVVTERHTTFERIRPPEAMRAIAVSTVTALPSSQTALDTFAALAEVVPAWSVRIGRDGGGTAAVRDLLDGGIHQS